MRKIDFYEPKPLNGSVIEFKLDKKQNLSKYFTNQKTYDAARKQKWSFLTRESSQPEQIDSLSIALVLTKD